jgi:hypothetical protein
MKKYSTMTRAVFTSCGVCPLGLKTGVDLSRSLYSKSVKQRITDRRRRIVC